MREISLSDTKSYNGRIEKNEAVRVYDCSGPWGDPAFAGTSEQGLPPLRRDWIIARQDVEEYQGRAVQPQDNGYLTEKHVEFASKSERANQFREFPGLTVDRRMPLRATGKPVTQKFYADQGIITPEMEFVAIRENQRIDELIDKGLIDKRLLRHHPGQSFGASLPNSTTAQLKIPPVPTLPGFFSDFHNGFRRKSPPSLFAVRSPLAGRSCLLTSIIPSANR